VPRIRSVFKPRQVLSGHFGCFRTSFLVPFGEIDVLFLLANRQGTGVRVYNPESFFNFEKESGAFWRPTIIRQLNQLAPNCCQLARPDLLKDWFDCFSAIVVINVKKKIKKMLKRVFYLQNKKKMFVNVIKNVTVFFTCF